MRQLRTYLLLVVGFSAPLWLAAQFLDATRFIPIKLPLSALQFLCVFAAAILVTRRQGGSVRALLARGLDFHRIRTTRWKVGIFVVMPVAVLLSYEGALACGVEVSRHWTPILSTPIFLLVYAVSGYCEQLGWTAIMTDALFARWSVIVTGLLTGVVWASWHIIPFIQTHNTPTWILWQCTFTILYRMLLTHAYVATGRSVFATVALHATYNTAFSLLPYYGSSYQPAYMALATLFVTMLVVRFGGYAGKKSTSEQRSV